MQRKHPSLGPVRGLAAQMRLFTIVFATVVTPLWATPNRSVVVVEKFLGSNPESYALLRTEKDNLGSHYSEHRKIWLDEYPKDTGPTAKARTTLLLEQHLSADPADGGKTAVSENSRAGKPSLADVVQRYPDMELVQWSAEQVAELDFDRVSGRTAYKSQVLLQAAPLLGERLRSVDSGVPLDLVAVAENGGNLYLTISNPPDEDHESRIICIPSSVTRNVDALRRLDPINLAVGIYQSVEVARTKVREMVEARSVHLPQLRIWSVENPGTGELEYAVVWSNSADMIRRNANLGAPQRGSLPIIPLVREDFRELIMEDSR